MGDQPQSHDRNAQSSPSTHPDQKAADPGESDASLRDDGVPTDTSSILMLAELERRVRSLELRVNELGRLTRAPRWQLKPSDVVRWVLWLVIIGFLAFYWTRFGGQR